MSGEPDQTRLDENSKFQTKEAEKPSDQGDGIKAKSTTTFNAKSEIPKKVSNGTITNKKNSAFNSLTKLKNRFDVQLRRFNKESKDLEEKKESIKKIHETLKTTKEEILKLNKTAKLDIPELKIGQEKNKEEAPSPGPATMGNTRVLISLQRQFTKVNNSLNESNAIRKELSEQLCISEKKCQELQRQLDEERTLKCEKETKIEQLKEKEEFEKSQEVKDINYQKFLTEQENERLTQINDVFQIELSGLKSKKEELEEEIAELQKRLKEANKESRHSFGTRLLQKENSIIKEILSQVRTEYKLLQQSFNDLKSEFEILNVNKDRNSVETKNLVDDLAKARRDVEKHKKDAERLQRDLKSEIKEKGELISMINKLKRKLVGHEVMEEGKKRVSKLSDKGMLEGDVCLIAAQFKAIKEENEKLQKEVETKDELFKERMNVFEQKAHEYVLETKNLAATLERFQKNKEKLEGEISSLRNRLACYENKIKTCNCSKLKDKIKRRASKIHMLCKRLKATSYKYMMAKDELYRIKKIKENE